jgi:hypothetical protein
MRTSMVLLYWADRLDGVVCSTLRDVIAGLEVALGPRATTRRLDVAEPVRIDDAQATRARVRLDLERAWAVVRRLSRRRSRNRLGDVGYALTSIADALAHSTESRPWRLALGDASVPEPALLIRRVLNGEDPERMPPLPRAKVKRRPLCLLAAEAKRFCSRLPILEHRNSAARNTRINGAAMATLWSSH